MALGERAESSGEVDLLTRRETLAAYEDDTVREEGGPQLGDLPVARGRELDTRELRTDPSGEPPHGDGGLARAECHGGVRPPRFATHDHYSKFRRSGPAR